MKLELFNKKDDNYSILLQGEIGSDINGYQLANEIKFLSEMGVKNVQIRINSIGGDVFQTYSILSEMNASNSNIETINVGVAYSCAAWILGSGKKGLRKALNYTSGMIHNAASNDSELAEIATRSIQKILSDNTGKTIDEITNAMNVETFFEGNEQKEFGLVDQIVNTSKKPVQVEDKYELMNIYKITNKSIKMEKVLNKLGVTDEAGALLKLAEVDNAHKLEVDTIKNEKIALESKIEELQNKIDEDLKVSVIAAVNKAIEDGKCAEESKDNMIEIGNTLGLEQLNKVFASVKVPHIDVANLAGGGGQGAQADEKKWEDYSLEERKDMKHKSPELYNKLIEDFQNR
jgi:ATP-dependent Clp protease protease subunit